MKPERSPDSVYSPGSTFSNRKAPLASDGPLYPWTFERLFEPLAPALPGSFHGDGRLPSTRDLADHLGTSRAVILQAYDQLLAEGFVTGRSGSGTYVAQGSFQPLSAFQKIRSPASLALWLRRGEDRCNTGLSGQTSFSLTAARSFERLVPDLDVALV